MQWNLIIIRKKHNLKQTDVAELLDVSADAYGQKERGQVQFKMDEMFLLSEYFDLPIEEIFLPRNFGITENIN